MPEITRVDTVGGDMLDIQLDNENIVLLSIKRLLSDDRFAQLMEDDRIFYPKTDGKRIYWHDGPSISVENIIDMVGMDMEEE